MLMKRIPKKALASRSWDGGDHFNGDRRADGKMTRAISRMSMEHIVNKMWTTICCDWENSPLTPEAQSAMRKFLGTIVQLIEFIVISRSKISLKKS
jgi:hypothetical protein